MTNSHVDVRTDEDIKLDVVEQLHWDERVDASRIRVTVIDRLVTLEGNVQTRNALDAASEDAAGIRGVLAVSNRVSVSPRETLPEPSDEALQEGIRTVYEMDSVLEEQAFQAKVRDGLVNLEGSVSAFWKKGRAAEIVAGFKGVKDIENHLSVVPTEDYVDQAVAESVTRALGRNALVDTDTITVEVEDGVVILTGTAPDWHAFSSASHTASHTAGVVDLHNRLVVYP
jgi:osmotically-inducible protein OsmY